MTDSEVVPTLTMDILPDEMWTEVLKHMSTKDRRPFRIASKRWRDYCNERAILKMEKLHLPGMSYLHDIMATLLTSQRSVMNLKFTNHRFDGDEVLWHRCGSAIEHLELENCAITYSSLEEILICCTNLTYLALRNVHIVHKTQIRRFGHTFIRISYSGVIASSVKTLVLDVYELLSDDELKLLFSVFPNLTDLEFNFHHLSHLSIELREPELFQLAHYDVNDKAYTCENFAKCLASSLPHLEHLTVKTPSYSCKCQEFVTKTPFCKLKIAEFHQNQTLCVSDDILPRISSFIPSLGCTYLTWIDLSPLVSANGITNMLREFQNLRKIEIKPIANKDYNDLFQLYHALAASKLESVSIREERFPTNSSQLVYRMLSEASFPVNSTVTELRIKCEREYDDLISLCFKCFSALTRFQLELLGCGEPKLDGIFQNKNLKCIEIKSTPMRRLSPDPCTSFMEHLWLDAPVDQLEYLRIEVNILRQLLVQKPTIFFTKLRYLHIASPEIRFLGNSTHSTIAPLTQWELRCFPRDTLEGVYFHVTYTSARINDIHTFFTNPFHFPRIRYIAIILPKPIDRDPYKEFFKSWFNDCPYLSIVMIMHKRTGICLYYDPIRGRVQECHPEKRKSSQTYNHAELYAELNTGVSLFHYFRNLTSFYSFWKNSS